MMGKISVIDKMRIQSL